MNYRYNNTESMAPEECYENGSELYSTDEIQSYKFEHGASIIVSVILPVMACFGLLFNLTFIYVVFRSGKMHTITNAFLVQLAICDFATLVFDTVRYIWIYVGSSGYDIQQGTVAGCTIFNFLFYYTYFVGVNFICLIAIERYFAICRPFTYHTFKGTSRARNVSIVCWSLGVLFSIAALVPQKLVTICAEIPNDSTTAVSTDETWIVFISCQPGCIKCFHVLYVFDTLQFAVVFAANFVMYFAIVRQLRQRSDRNIGVKADYDPDAASKLNRDIALMLVINGVAFFTLLGPYQIWNVVLLIYDYTEVLIISEKGLYWLGWVSRLCAPINFSINPLIYGGSNKYYRQAFLEVFGCASSDRTSTHKVTASTSSTNV